MAQDQLLMSLSDVTIRARNSSLGPFSFKIKKNERIAILGPSGAGKSSLLQIMTGLHDNTGQIEFLSKSLKHWSLQELACKRAFLPQQHEIAFNLSSEMIISLGRVAREHDPQLLEIIQESAKAARAEHLLQRPYQTLSGGEKARVHLARIFAQLWDQQDGILLIDEPLAALDPGLQIELLSSILNFCQDRSHTLVAVLHDIQQATQYFDRLLLIRDGQVMADLPSHPVPKHHLEALYEMRLECIERPGRKGLLIPCGQDCTYTG
jgi:iron complex transport system ATP-binding protein